MSTSLENAHAIAASFAVTATPAAAGWHGHGYGGGLAVGLLGAAVIGGAIAASQPSYAYGGCELRRQPVYNNWGDVIGFRRVRLLLRFGSIRNEGRNAWFHPSFRGESDYDGK